MDRILAVRRGDGVLSALQRDGRIRELQFDRPQDAFAAGTVYLGRVQTVSPNLHAAFVCLDGRQMGYLPYAEGKAPRAGEEFPVQIETEAMRTKQPRLTRDWNLPGRSLVLLSARGGLHLSKRLPEETADGLRELLAPYLKEYGFIVRTNGAETPPEELLAEAEALVQRARRLRAEAPHRPCFSCLLKGPEGWLEFARDRLKADGTEFVTDDPALFAGVSGLFEGEPALRGACRLYSDPQLPLSALYSLETALEEALSRRVWLKSGGYLIIEQTEALTAVDVNSGRCDRPGQQEKIFFRINEEAARELARQLQLRNLSGMILVDFISLRDRTRDEELLALLRAETAADPVPVQVLDMTALGLAELTRKKRRPTLREQLAGGEKTE